MINQEGKKQLILSIFSTLFVARCEDSEPRLPASTGAVLKLPLVCRGTRREQQDEDDVSSVVWLPQLLITPEKVM